MYSTDARIKTYVEIVKENNIDYEIWALKEKSKGEKFLKQIMNKYNGNSNFLYLVNYLLFSMIIFFKALIIAWKFDIIHYNNMPNFPIFSFFPMHDSLPATYISKSEILNISFFIKILKFEEKISANFADFVITAVHRQNEDLYQYGISEKKILTFLNIPHPLLFEKNSKLRNNAESFVIIFHGTITKRLGLDLALKALKVVLRKIPSAKLKIIGDGDYINELILESEKLNIKDNVIFNQKYIPVESLVNELSDANIGIVPYKKNYYSNEYQLPVKLIEYALLNLPIITPRLKNISNYFDDTMVLYFNPDDVNDFASKIISLNENIQLAESLVKNAKNFFKTYSWKKQALDYTQILNNLKK